MPNERPAPFFIADDVALDFLNSRASPSGSVVEWIADGSDLLAWLTASNRVSAGAAAAVRSRAGDAALDRVAERARDLREWFRAFVAEHAGQPVDAAVLDRLLPLNALLARASNYQQIDGESGHLCWRRERRIAEPEDLLLPAAEAMGDLVCTKDFRAVRRCQGVGCTLWFIDTSKAGTRRWCSMAACGNRAKAAQHRARLRADGARVP